MNNRRVTRNVLVLTQAFAALLLGWASTAAALQCSENFAGPHCWCKIRVGCTGYVVHDFGGICRYRAIASGKKSDCAQRCTDVSQQYGTAAVQASGAAICSDKGAGTWKVNAYSVVGASDWENNACDTDQGFGSVTCTKIPRVCRCPAGWSCNGCSPQVDGGITNDGKCKKLACQPDQILPFPADGTQIGDPAWGFSWGNAFYAWGTTANGGAPTCMGGGYDATWGRRGDSDQCTWTGWLNRDNPGGTGDFETLADFVRAGQVCASPKRIDCQTLNGLPASSTGQPYTCDPQVGGVCDNRKLAAGQTCADYRVRFCC